MLSNFSWVVENIIAGSALPHEHNHFDFLEENGIKVIINLTSEKTSVDYSSKFKLHHLHIPDYSVPDTELMDKFWNICDEAEKNNEPVVVHCFAGCGRTGTMLASWLVRKHKVMNGDEAIIKLRKLRPCSIETEEQENFVKYIAKKIHHF